jgi:hypothetical protein
MVLYKYRKLNENTLKTISENVLASSHILDFNDPFDSNSSIHFDESFYENPVSFFDHFMLTKYEKDAPEEAREIRKITAYFAQGKKYDIIKEYILKVYHYQFEQIGKNDVGITCFSKVHDNILMWSHYADNHKGVVLQIEPSSEPLIHARAVQYENDYFMFTKESKQNRAEIIKPFFQKSKQWEYEQEIRFVCPYGTGLIKFDPKDLKAIYFGCRCNDNEIDKVLSIVKLKKHIIKLFKAKKDYNSYRLIFDEIVAENA